MKLGFGGVPRYSTKYVDLGSAPPFFWSRSMVELLELGMFAWKNLKQSWFFRSGDAWSRAKHALNLGAEYALILPS
jgi:hypothetical protein